MFNKKRKPSFGGSFKRKRTVFKSRNTVYRRARKKFKKEHPSLQTPKKRYLVLLLSILSALLLYLFYFSPYFNLQNFKIIKEDTSKQSLSDALILSLEEYKGLNLTSINTLDISNNIKTNFKEINEIKISKDYPNTLEIEYTEYPLMANVICESDDLIKSYIINSIGYIIEENLENTNLPTIKMHISEPINPENALIEANKLRYILESITYFTDKFGMGVKEVIFEPIPREVHLLTDRNFYIWLDIQRPFEDQLKKLKKAHAKLDIYNEELEYIDLRIAGQNGEKIIYK